MDGSNLLHGLGQLRLCVLDDVTFIENAIVPVHVLEAADVVPNDFVRGHYHVIRLQLREQLVPFSRVSGVEHRLQVLRVLKDLVVPVASESGRADDERW